MLQVFIGRDRNNKDFRWYKKYQTLFVFFTIHVIAAVTSHLSEQIPCVRTRLVDSYFPLSSQSLCLLHLQSLRLVDCFSSGGLLDQEKM